MRTLAGALGTGPMTLYNYVKDRDELDALVVEAVLAEVRRPRSHADWQADVRAIVEATWRTVRRHPNVIPLVLTRRTQHDTTLQWAEGLLEALARSGRRDTELLVAFRTVSGFVMGLAQAQLSGPPTSDHPDVARAEALPARPLSAADRDRQGGDGARARTASSGPASTSSWRAWPPADQEVLKAWRARSFQAPPSFTQTCMTPTLACDGLPSVSVSTTKTWRAMALLPTTVTVGSLSVIDL